MKINHIPLKIMSRYLSKTFCVCKIFILKEEKKKLKKSYDSIRQTLNNISYWKKRPTITIELSVVQNIKQMNHNNNTHNTL